MRVILATLLTLIASAAAHAQSTYTAQIHNAPGWQPSHTYTYSAGPPTAPFARVLAGAGWNPGGGTSGTWIPGSPLNAYQLTSTGTCTSTSSGKGPSGTGSAITDGTCTWKYVSEVDYISITGWNLDNGSVWTSGTVYGYGHMVQTGANLNVYQLINQGCLSTVQPTGTVVGGIEGGSGAGGGVVTADGCQWGYRGSIYYTSRAHSPPMGEFYFDSFQGYISGNTLTVTTPPAIYPLSSWGNDRKYLSGPGVTVSGPYGQPYIVSGTGRTYTLSSSWIAGSAARPVTFYFSDDYSGVMGTSYDLYVAQLWNDREYRNGQNGELSPIRLWNHNYQNNDSAHGMVAAAGSPGATASYAFGFGATLRAAPGESFADTLAANPGVALSGYNINNGVGIRGTGAAVPGILTNDNYTIFTGLQIKSDNYMAETEYPGRACNGCQFVRNIFEGGQAGLPYPVADCGANCLFYNNLVVSNGAQGLGWDYGGLISNNTIVCPPGTCATAVINSRDWRNLRGIQFNGNLVFGFAHLIGTWDNSTSKTGSTWNCGIYCATWEGTGNVTDLPSSDGSDYPATTTPIWGGSTGYVQQFATSAVYCGHWSDAVGNTFVPTSCGILNNQSPTAVFAAWPGNYRINASSPAYGAGSAYGVWNACGVGIWTGITPPAGTWSGCTIRPDTPDLIGTTRPQGARYDAGAIEF